MLTAFVWVFFLVAMPSEPKGEYWPASSLLTAIGKITCAILLTVYLNR